MNKIVILDGSASTQNDLNFNQLQTLCPVEYYDSSTQDTDEIVGKIGDANIITTNKINITKAVMDRCPNLKLVAVLATGYNNVDCSYAREKGIIVCNVPAYSSESVVQHTFALLFELASKISKYNSEVHNGDWVKSKVFCFYTHNMIELSHKTFGIIGYGNIGKQIEKVAKALGMNVLIYTRTPFEGSVTLEELLKNSDIISLHCPLTEANVGLINKNTISLMKKTAFLINTARGGLINEIDLADALNEGVIAGAGLDVLTQEPPKDSNPLLVANNCIITPHVAWATKEARSRLLDITYENIKAFINGCPNNIVNK